MLQAQRNKLFLRCNSPHAAAGPDPLITPRKPGFLGGKGGAAARLNGEAQRPPAQSRGSAPRRLERRRVPSALSAAMRQEGGLAFHAAFGLKHNRGSMRFFSA